MCWSIIYKYYSLNSYFLSFWTHKILTNAQDTYTTTKRRYVAILISLCSLLIIILWEKVNVNQSKEMSNNQMILEKNMNKNNAVAVYLNILSNTPFLS